MEPTAQSLARTYSHPSYADPWEAVEDYRRVQRYTADHPDAGRVRVGNALGLPPSRVRGWMNDTLPSPARAVQTATEYGWIDPDPAGEEAAGLVRLAAHVLAGGSINSHYVPSVTVGGTVDTTEIQSAFADVGLDTTVNRASESGRATEVFPRDDGSLLGRCLTCMGVPQGPTKHAVDGLPPVIDSVSDTVRRQFVRLMIRHRGVNYDTKDTSRVMAERPESYLRELANLIQTVTDERATADSRGVTITASAMRALELHS